MTPAPHHILYNDPGTNTVSGGMDQAEALFTRPAKPAAEPLTPDEVAELLRIIEEQRTEIARLRSNAPVRSSLEVFQRMANGLDPFDIGRFKCAMAALPHETPKLSASVSMTGNLGIAERLDQFNRDRARQKADERGLRVIEAEPKPA